MQTKERCIICELSAASWEGDLEAVKALVEEGAEALSTLACNTALWNAIDEGHVAVVEKLLQSGADSNPQR